MEHSRIPTIAAAAAVAVAAGGVFLWWRSSGQSASLDEGPLMTEKEVVDFFKTMNSGLARVAAQLMQNVKSLSAQIPDPAQIQQILVAEYEKQVTQRQAQLLKEMKADDEDLEQATMYWMAKGSKEVEEQVNTFKEIYSKIGGMVEEDLPEDLTIDKFCEVLDDYFKSVFAGQEMAMMELQKHGGNPPRALQEQVQEMASQMQARALAKHNMTLSTLQTALKTFHGNPKLQAKVHEMESQAQMRQQMSQAARTM